MYARGHIFICTNITSTAKKMKTHPHNLLAFALIISFFNRTVSFANNSFSEDKKKIEESIKNIPVSFRKNMGQWDGKVLYRGSSPGWNAEVTFLRSGMSFGFAKSMPNVADANSFGLNEEDKLEYMVWNMNFKNSNPNCVVNSFGEKESHTNYLYSSSPDKNQLNVPDYRMIEYKNLYPGIDAKYYWSNNNLKYDYILNPGSNVLSIEAQCEGIKKLSIENKKLMITTEWGTLEEHMPESYQVINGEKKNVAVEYRLINDNTFGFAITESYDRTQPLVIDPVTLDWSTFVSGNSISGSGYLYDIDVDVDANGNVYATGGHNDGFPITPGVYSTAFSGGTFGGALYNTLSGSDVFVIKLDPTGSSLLLSTYVGGSLDDAGRSIRVASNGDIYVVGTTGSFVPASPFPTTINSYKPYSSAAHGIYDAFLFKLDPGATTLLYSTLIGGTDEDRAEDLDVDARGDAYVCGYTQSLNITGAGNAFLGGNRDAFVCKISPQSTGATDLKYFRYLGGNNIDVGFGIKTNSLGEAYVVGSTRSSNMYTSPVCLDNLLSGTWDGFVCRVNSLGSALDYSSYLGGSSPMAGTYSEAATDIAIASNNDIVIAGQTVSTDFPTTPGAFDNSFNATTSTWDVFISRINPTVNGIAGLVYSTYVGGSNNDFFPELVLNSQDEIFMVCHVYISRNMPVIPLCSYDANISSMEDIYFAKLSSDLSQIFYSTYLGMGGNDYYPSIDLFGNCDEYVYIGATTHSLNFPTTAGAYQNGARPNSNSSYDEGTILKFKSTIIPDFTYNINHVACTLPVVSFTDNTKQGACSLLYPNWSVSNWFWDFGDGTTSTLQNPVHTYSVSGTYQVKLRVNCPLDSVIIPLNIVANPPLYAFIPTQNNLACYGDNSGSAIGTALGGIPGYQYQWSTNPIQNTNTATGLSAGVYTLTVNDNAGCTATKAVTIVQPPQLLVSALLTTSISCNGGNSGILSSVTIGGTPPYNYSWNTTSTTSNISSITAGIYSITVTDQYGCQTLATYNLTEPSAIAVNIITTDVLCNATATGSATAAGSGGAGGYTYHWSNSTIGSGASSLPSGIYSVTVIDANGCVGIGTTNVGQPTALSLSFSSTDAHCNQSDGSATATPSGGTAGYNYIWNNGNASAFNNNIPFGIYSVTVTDANACSVLGNITVANLNGVVASIASSSNTRCNGACDGTATAGTAGGSGPYVYNWSTGGAAIAEPGLCAGVFSVTITDANGCKDITSVTISQPAAISSTVQATSVSCFGENNGSTSVTSTVGGTPPYNFSWQAGTVGVSANNLYAGVYSVTVSDANNCTAVFSTNISEPTQLTAATSDAFACAGSTTSINATANGATPGYIYNWNNGLMGATINFIPLYSSIYTVTITDAKGCTAVAQSSVTVLGLPVIDFTTDVTNGCGPLCINLSSGNNPAIVQCHWNFGDNTTSNNCGTVNHCFANPGSYNISLTSKDVNGCSSSITKNNFITVHPNPIAAFTATPKETSILNPNIYFKNNSVGATSWQWDFGDVNNNTSTTQNTSYTYADTGYYVVILEISNEFGCKSITGDYVRILPDVAVYIPNSFTPNSDGTNDLFNPMGVGIDGEKYELIIYDRWGSLIFQSNNPAKGWDGIVMGGSEAAQQDTYVWKIRFDDILGQKKRYTGHVNLIK